jgi:YVTN family beta-propeller protein
MSYRLRTLAAFVPLAAVTFLVAPLGHAAEARGATEVYVSGEESGEIIVVDLGKEAVAARIPVGKRPRGIKLSRDGKLLYVALSGRRPPR